MKNFGITVIAILAWTLSSNATCTIENLSARSSVEMKLEASSPEVKSYLADQTLFPFLKSIGAESVTVAVGDESNSATILVNFKSGSVSANGSMILFSREGSEVTPYLVSCK